MASQIDLPFRFENGAIATTGNPHEVARINLISLVGTEPGERCMRPTYGVATRSLLFDSNDPVLVERINVAVEQSALSNAPEVRVQAVEINSTRTAQRQDGVALLTVRYTPVSVGTVDVIGVAVPTGG